MWNPLRNYIGGKERGATPSVDLSPLPVVSLEDLRIKSEIAFHVSGKDDLDRIREITIEGHSDWDPVRLDWFMSEVEVGRDKKNQSGGPVR